MRGPVEQVFENLRPRPMVPRTSCVFGTDSPILIGLLVKGRTSSVVYRVEVPPHAEFSGRFDMKLVASTANPHAVAQTYWTGQANAVERPHPEVLATELLVLENFGDKFSADILVALKYRDLTLADLVNGVVDLPPE